MNEIVDALLLGYQFFPLLKRRLTSEYERRQPSYTRCELAKQPRYGPWAPAGRRTPGGVALAFGGSGLVAACMPISPAIEHSP